MVELWRLLKRLNLEGERAAGLCYFGLSARK